VGVSKLIPDRKYAPVTIIGVAAHPFTLNKYGPGHASIELHGHMLPITYDPEQTLWHLSNINMEYFDPKQLEFKYDLCSEIPEILTMASSPNTFVLLFMGVIAASGIGYIPGTQIICLLLHRVEGYAPIFKMRGIVTKAGEAAMWRSSVPRTNIVLV
jgi:hypothetical protein